MKNEIICPYNDGVVCSDLSKCARCGWNERSGMAEKRIEKAEKEIKASEEK